jgi:aspartyl-tRNA(Asn)/glutamyl-tRNA(Gln) amidotransferase subunit A
MYLEDIYTIAVNLAGLPAISLPNGLSSHNKPLGMQLIGPQRGDAMVLSCAHAFETVSQGYKLIAPLALL